MKKICITMAILSIFVALTCAENVFVLEDFEADISSCTKNSRLNGTLETCGTEFVVSGKQSLKYVVDDSTTAKVSRPFVLYTPKTADWTGYNSLKMYVLALPSNHLLREYAFSLQVRSQNYDRLNKATSSSLFVTAPVGRPVLVTFPIDRMNFRSAVKDVVVSFINSNGAYYIDKIVLSTDTVKTMMAESIPMESSGNVPQWYSLRFNQEGSCYYRGVYNYDPGKKVELVVEYNKPVTDKIEKTIVITSSSTGKSVEYKMGFESNDIVKTVEVALTPDEKNVVSFNGEDFVFMVKDLVQMVKSNLDTYAARKKTGDPFSRGIVSMYAGHIYDKDKYPDIPKIIDMLKDAGVNNYSYLIYGQSAKEYAKLPGFCAAAAKEGIEVWVYLVPPTEAPINRGDKDIQKRKYPPFNMDYVKWMVKLSRISLKYPNLTMIMIDDFYHNWAYFTLDYTKKMYEAMKKINPKLLLGQCVYREQIDNCIKAGYLPYIDAFVWGYQHSSAADPEAGLDCSTLPVDIYDYYNLCKDKLIFPCIYFTPHSSWPKGRPTKEYLEKAMQIEWEQTGIMWVYTTPPKGSWKYEMIKKFTAEQKLELLK
ncbi:MAG: hypothetical protein WC955_04885 [Elusimicrobiota bacterium]